MAEWTKIAVPLGGGLDTKTDAKVVLPSKMTVLENSEFTKGGSAKKRFGYDRVPLQTSDGTAISDELGLATKEQELLLLTQSSVYSYDTKEGTFRDKGEYCPMTWTARGVVGGTSQQTRGDVATNSGVTAYAWADSRGGVRYQLEDAATGAAFITDGSLSSSNASEPKVVAAGENLVITYRDTSNNDLKFKLIRPGDITGSIAAAVGDLTTDLSSNSDYDVVGGPDGFWVLYENSGGGVTLNLAKYNTAGVVQIEVNVTTADVERPLALAYNETTGKLLVGYATTASGDTTVAEYTGSCSPTGVSVTITQSGTLEGIALAALDNGTLCAFSTEVSGGAYTTSWVHRTTAGVSTTGSILKGHVYSSGWNHGNNGYFILSYDSTTQLQDCYFVYRHDGVLVGRLMYREGNGHPRTGSAFYGPRVSAVGDGTYQLLVEYRRSMQTDKGATKDVVSINAQYGHVGLRKVVFDPEPVTSNVELEGTTYLGGSMLWAYDGGPHPVEAAPLLFPEILTGSITQSGLGAMTSGNTYNYRVYAEYTLANGQKVRSAAITRSFTTAATTKVNIVIPCIPFTRNLGDRANLNFVVYRTENNKSDLYYRISSPDPTATGDNAYVANDPAAASVTFLDNEPTDTDITGNELDYQCTGETPHFAPDGTSFVANAANRLFLTGGGTKPNNVIASLLRFDGEPAHFADHTVISETPTYGGPVVGVAPLSDVLAVFKQRAVFAVAGQGPDNTNGPGFFESRAVSADLGCSDPGTIVSLPIGVMFKSAKGFQLLTNDFQLLYVGADVELYNNQTFVAAAPIPDSNMVVFVSADGNALVFDWHYRSWAVWTNHDALDAVVWKEDTFAYLRTDGYVFLRTNSYTDGGSPYAMKLRTAPIRVDNTVQGFWLLKTCTVLGDYRSSHRLVARLLYDRDEDAFEAFTVTPAGFVETDTYGDDTPYGEADYYGGDIASSEYQFQLKPKRSKTQTIRFEFYDIPVEDPGASYEITELLLEVGLRPNEATKLPASRKV